MYEASGALSRLNVAFSRDSREKVYVQHHLERDAGTRVSPTLCVAQNLAQLFGLLSLVCRFSCCYEFRSNGTMYA